MQPLAMLKANEAADNAWTNDASFDAKKLNVKLE